MPASAGRGACSGKFRGGGCCPFQERLGYTLYPCCPILAAVCRAPGPYGGKDGHEGKDGHGKVQLLPSKESMGLGRLLDVVSLPKLYKLLRVKARPLMEPKDRNPNFSAEKDMYVEKQNCLANGEATNRVK